MGGQEAVAAAAARAAIERRAFSRAPCAGRRPRDRAPERRLLRQPGVLGARATGTGRVSQERLGSAGLAALASADRARRWTQLRSLMCTAGGNARPAASQEMQVCTRGHWTQVHLWV